MPHPCHQYLNRLKDQFESDRLAIVWGNFKSYHKITPMKRWLGLLDRDMTILSCETPVIGRDRFEQCARVEPYFRIGIWNTSTLNRGGFNIPENATDDRLTLILKTCGISYQWKPTNGCDVLYCLQTMKDTSLQGTDAEQAAIYDLIDLTYHTDRPIKVVRHPFAQEPCQLVENFCTYRGIEIVDGPASRHFERAFCTVSQSSSTAVDGLLAGVPAVTLNEGSFARPCSVHRISDLESCSLEGVHEWLCRLAYVQWKPITEIEDCLSHLNII